MYCKYKHFLICNEWVYYLKKKKHVSENECKYLLIDLKVILSFIKVYIIKIQYTKKSMNCLIYTYIFM